MPTPKSQMVLQTLHELDEWEFVEGSYSPHRPPQHKAANLSSVQAAAASADDASDGTTVISGFSILSFHPDTEFPPESCPATGDSNKSHPDTDPNTLDSVSSRPDSMAEQPHQPLDAPTSLHHSGLTVSELNLHSIICPPRDHAREVFWWLGGTPGLLARGPPRHGNSTLDRPGPRSTSNFSDASFTSNTVPVKATDDSQSTVKHAGAQFGSTPTPPVLSDDDL